MTDLVFGPGEHIGSIGMTGAGKTVWERSVILPAFGRHVVIDSKAARRPDGITDFPEWPKATPKDVVKASTDPSVFFQWRMVWGHAEEDLDAMEQFCFSILEKGKNVAVCFDEVTDFSDAQRIGPGLRTLLRTGRSLGIQVIWGSQRPQMVSKDIWNNTAHKFAFWVDPYDATVAHPYFPELKARLKEIPWKSYQCLYKDPSGEVHLMPRAKVVR